MGRWRGIRAVWCGLVAPVAATAMVVSTTPAVQAAPSRPAADLNAVDPLAHAAAEGSTAKPWAGSAAAVMPESTPAFDAFGARLAASTAGDDIGDLLDGFLNRLPDPESFTFTVHSIHDGVEKNTEAVAFSPNLIDVTGDGIADVSVRLTAVPNIPEAISILLEELATSTGLPIAPNLDDYFALLTDAELTLLFDRLLGLLGFLYGVSPEVRQTLAKLAAFLEMAEESDALRSATGELNAVPLNGGASLVIERLSPVGDLPALIEAIITLDPDEGDTVRAGYDGRQTTAPAKFIGVVAEGSESIDISLDTIGAGESLTMLGGLVDVKPGEGSTDIDAAVDYSPVPHQIRLEIAQTEGNGSESLRIDTFHDAQDAPPQVDGVVNAVVEGAEPTEVNLDLGVVDMPTTLGVTHASNPGQYVDDEGEPTSTNELHYRSSSTAPEIDVTANIATPGKTDAVHARLLNTTAATIDLVQDGDTFDIQTAGGTIGRTDAAFSKDGPAHLMALPPRDPSLPEAVHIDNTDPDLEGSGLVSLNGLSGANIDWQELVKGTDRFQVSLTHEASPMHIEVRETHRHLSADLNDLPSVVENVEVTFREEKPEVPDGESPSEGPHDVDGDGLYDEKEVDVDYQANDTIATISATIHQDAVAADPVAGQDEQEHLHGTVTLVSVPVDLGVHFNAWKEPTSTTTCDEGSPCDEVYEVTYDASGELGEATIDFNADQSGVEEDGQPTSSLGAAGRIHVQLEGLPGGETTATVTDAEDEKLLDFDSDGRIGEVTFRQVALEGGWLDLHGDPDGDTGNRKTTHMDAHVVDIPTSVDVTVRDGAIDASTTTNEPGIGLFEFREADRAGAFRSSDGLEFIDRESDYRVSARISGLQSVSFEKTAQLYAEGPGGPSDFVPITDEDGNPVRSCSDEDFAEYEAFACDEDTVVDIHTDNGGAMFVNVSKQDASEVTILVPDGLGGFEEVTQTVWSPRKDLVLDADLPAHGNFKLRLSKRHGEMREVCKKAGPSSCDDEMTDDSCSKTYIQQINTVIVRCWRPGSEPVFAWWDGHGDDGGRIQVNTTDARHKDDKVKTLSVSLDPLPAELHACLDTDSGHCWSPGKWYNRGSYFFDSTTRTAVRVTYKDFKHSDWTVLLRVSLKALAFAYRNAPDFGPDDKQIAMDTDGFEVYGLDGGQAVDVKGALDLNLPQTRNIPAFYAQDFYSHIDIDLIDDDQAEFEKKSGELNCPIDFYDGNAHQMLVALKDTVWKFNATLKTFYELVQDELVVKTTNPEGAVWKNKLYATGALDVAIEDVQCGDYDRQEYVFDFPRAS